MYDKTTNPIYDQACRWLGLGFELWCERGAKNPESVTPSWVEAKAFLDTGKEDVEAAFEFVAWAQNQVSDPTIYDVSDEEREHMTAHVVQAEGALMMAEGMLLHSKYHSGYVYRALDLALYAHQVAGDFEVDVSARRAEADRYYREQCK